MTKRMHGLALSLFAALVLPVFGQSTTTPAPAPTTPKAVAAMAMVEHFPKKGESGPYVWNTGVYSYDGAGNVTNIGSQYYVYDTASRLKESLTVAPAGSYAQSYIYDVYGNQTSRTSSGIQQSIGIDVTTNHLNGLPTTYDAAGNLTSWQPANSAYV